MTAKDLAAPFEVAASTASSKAAQIKKMLKIDYFHAEWCLPSEAASNPMLWMVSIDGLVFDNNDEALYQGLKMVLKAPEILDGFKKTILETAYGNEKEIAVFDQLITRLR